MPQNLDSKPLAPAEGFSSRAGIFLLALLFLCACGKMPSDVDPPSGVSRDVYSRVYPDAAEDPRP